MTLSEFITKTKGTKQALPNGNQLGQCVSLVQQYLIQCYNIPFKARGHAKNFGKSIVSEGLAKQVTTPVYGDIIVYAGSISNMWYGHVAIYIDDNYMYDQNNGTHDKYRAGYSKHLAGTRTYYRLNRTYKIGKYRLLKSKAIRYDHKLGQQYILKVKDIMLSKRKLLTSKKLGDDAYYNISTILDIKEIYIDNMNRVWGRTINTWVVLINANGSPQAEYLGE